MNNARRKAITKISDKLDQLREELDALMQEEQEYYDVMPEAFQDGEKGERAQEAIDNMDYALTSIQEAVDYLNEASI